MDIDVQELSVQRTSDAVALTREWVAGWSHHLPSAVASDVELLTHELVTNAFRHSATERAWVTALMLPDSVLVQVTDEGRGSPQVRALTLYAESGRGLRWVSTLSRAWGVHQGNTTGVWFQVDYPAPVLTS